MCLSGRQWPECLSVQTDGRASSKAAGPGSPQQAQCPAGIDRPGIIPPPTDPMPQYSRQMLPRSEEHTSELQSLMRISYAVFCLKKKNTNYTKNNSTTIADQILRTH